MQPPGNDVLLFAVLWITYWQGIPIVEKNTDPGAGVDGPVKESARRRSGQLPGTDPADRRAGE